MKRYKKLSEDKMKKIFLGGTLGGTNVESDWREKLISLLKIKYFNPVVENWTPSDQKEEIKQRETCDFCLYYITSKMQGVYAIAEAIDDSNKRPEKTIFGFDSKGFSESQIKSLDQVSAMVKSNGGKNINTLEAIAKYVNKN